MENFIFCALNPLHLILETKFGDNPGTEAATGVVL